MRSTLSGDRVQLSQCPQRSRAFDSDVAQDEIERDADDEKYLYEFEGEDAVSYRNGQTTNVAQVL